MTASSATASTFLVAVLIPGDDASPLQSLLVPAEERFATIIDPKNAINVIQSLLIRPTSEQPGLYGHHDPSATAMTHPNVRATRLAMACGLFSYRFHGDVIVSRGRHLAVDEIFSACCVSPDLRACLSLTVTIPEWLGNACRDNYHDADVLSRLAQVMNRPSEADENEDFDARSTASEDDPSGRDDKANPSSADIAKSEFVTKVPLCLHCRRPAFTLCPDCSGAYFCEPPATCRRNG